MRKLDYVDPPQITNYKTPTCREYLRKVSEYSCVYCTITESESPGATFNIEHFRPQALFPKLTNDIYNLRYSCPRCNSYKRDNWIRKNDGCINDCEKCQNCTCLKNSFRFLDCLHEDPADHFILQADSTILPINGSKPAEHTIKFLRLNRAQLVKLRQVRDFLGMWEEDLKTRREQAIKDCEKIDFRFSEFNSKYPNKISLESINENKLYDIITTIFKMLQINAVRTIELIDNELAKLDLLIGLRSGADEVF